MTSDPSGASQAPDSLAEQALETGIRAARKGNKNLARRLLLKVTELDPSREEAWLWLASVAEDSEEARVYLQTVLALNPDNRRALEGLQWVEGQALPEAEARLCPECQNAIPGGESSCPLCGHRPGEGQAMATGGGKLDTAPLPRLSTTGELAPSFVLSVEQAEAIDACLEKMAYESEAHCIILADVTGQLIAERGKMGNMNTQVLSALAAGELAATHEMARLVGEEARFKLLLHEGEEQSVYLSDVGEQLILVIVFDNETPIGLVRLVLKQAVEELAPILLEPGQAGSSSPVQEALGSDFAQLLESELNASLEI